MVGSSKDGMLASKVVISGEKYLVKGVILAVSCIFFPQIHRLPTSIWYGRKGVVINVQLCGRPHSGCLAHLSKTVQISDGPTTNKRISASFSRRRLLEDVNPWASFFCHRVRHRIIGQSRRPCLRQSGQDPCGSSSPPRRRAPFRQRRTR